MSRHAHVAAALVASAALAACSTQFHGVQSVSGGASTTTVSSAVAASASTSGGQVSFVSGTPVSPRAPGGQVSLSTGGFGPLMLGIIAVDAISQFASWLAAPATPAGARPASIADTCSCYKKEGDK